MTPRQQHDADIAIIGSGASGTHGLLEILSELSTASLSADDPLRILVVERDDQFHAGIPYGTRSGRGSLLISSLTDFLDEPHRSDFVSWLNELRSGMLRWATAHDHTAAANPEDPAEAATDSLLESTMMKEWARRHADDIRAGNWGPLYLPRRLYGHYLADRVAQAIAAAGDEVAVEFVHADVNEISDPDCAGTWLREIGPTGDVEFAARALTVLLAVGSPPVRRLGTIDIGTADGAEASAAADSSGLIEDIHSPNIDSSLATMTRHLKSVPTADRRILLIGGNADALEFLIVSDPLRRELGAELTIISPQGRPRHWHRAGPDEHAATPAVDGLLTAAETGAQVRARDFHAAVRSDLALAREVGNDTTTVVALMASVGPALGMMDDYEHAAMVSDHGIPVSNLLRQAGGDSIDALEDGLADGTITCIPGRLRSVVRSGRGFVPVLDGAAPSNPLSGDHGPGTRPDHSFAVVVNATGFENVTDTRSPLLRGLLGSGRVDASVSHAGLRLDASFRAAPGLYVLGPLMSGFHHERTTIWHVESVARIIRLSSQIAPALVADALARKVGSSTAAVV